MTLGTRLRKAVCAAAVLAATACAARGPVRPSERRSPVSEASGQPASDSLGTFIGKVRALSVRARPPVSRAQTLEAGDPALAAALLQVALAPTAASHRAVADEYARLGVLDKAHEHLSAAVRIDPRDAAAWDRLARIWRDWGFPLLGLGDAYRALHFAPESPVVHNTLGTVLQALGHHEEARKHYRKALQLDATAAYALNNFCYSSILDGRAGEAVEACRRALRVQPGLHTTRNNLGLAYAVTGDFGAAVRVFTGAGERARAQYNLGIVHLAHRRYAAALKAFEAAQALRPGFRAAAVMARHARQQADQRTQR